MAEIVNLRLARKRKARADKARQSAENRVRSGLTKAERVRDRAEAARLHDHVEQHRLEPEGGT